MAARGAPDLLLCLSRQSCSQNAGGGTRGTLGSRHRRALHSKYKPPYNRKNRQHRGTPRDTTRAGPSSGDAAAALVVYLSERRRPPPSRRRRADVLRARAPIKRGRPVRRPGTRHRRRSLRNDAASTAYRQRTLLDDVQKRQTSRPSTRPNLSALESRSAPSARLRRNHHAATGPVLLPAPPGRERPTPLAARRRRHSFLPRRRGARLAFHSARAPSSGRRTNSAHARR